MTCTTAVPEGCVEEVQPVATSSDDLHTEHAVDCITVVHASWPCHVQLESQREAEAEKAAKKHEEVAQAHSRLKRLDKDLKQLMTNQVCRHPLNGEVGIPIVATDVTGVPLNCKVQEH